MKIFEKLRLHRIGFVEAHVKISEKTILISRSVLYVREPFLWFKTRKVVEIGDYKAIEDLELNSPHYRQYKLKVRDWLLGGKIDYISKNGTNKPCEIVRLVK